MLKLTPNQNNTVYLSLWENSTAPLDNYYLLVLTSLQKRTSEAKVVTKGAANERAIPLSFDITDDVLTGSEPKFLTDDVSFYKYEVYEQTSSTNVDIEDASVLGKREEGKAWVDGTSEVTYILEPENETTNSIYFKV